MSAGDPGLLSGIVKAVSKVVAPIAKVAAPIAKIPVVGSLITKVAPRVLGGPVGAAITAVQLGGAAMKGARGVITGIAAKVGRPAGGSPITSGPLMLGGKNLLPSRPGVGPVLMAGGATALGAAIGGAVSRRKPKTQTRPSAARTRTRRATATRARCGCPTGKHHVCFKNVYPKKRRATKAGSRRSRSLRGAPRDARGRLLPRR